MTKAPFSVEWLSQSSQALRSPTESSPHRASSASRRLGSGPSLGQSERSREQPAGPRDGRGGRSRERLAATPAAGTRGPGTAWGSREGVGGPGTPPGRGRHHCAVAARGRRRRAVPHAVPGPGSPFPPCPCPQEQAGGRRERGSPCRRRVPSARAPRSPAGAAGGGCARRSARNRSAPWRAPSSGSSTWAPPSAGSWRAGCASPRCR